MRIALIADAFPPMRTSGAVQLRDLAREFARQGHDLTVLLPAHDLATPWQAEAQDGFEIIRLRAPRTKDVGYIRRTLAELAMPWAMRRNLARSPYADRRWDGVVWYSPSIFHAPLVKALKRASGCKSYLIIRDIFPEWAADMGLMRRGAAFHFFKAIANRQYAAADVIGVQSPGNLSYFEQWRQGKGRTLEVLPNWLDKPGTARCPIRVEDTPLAGRKIFVYAGNMGVAQNMDVVIDLADKLRDRPDIGFLLVGRGSEVERLRRDVADRALDNIAFFDEIDPDAIPDLYRQCSVGIVALDPRHRSHNIPGKFLTYMQCGLPVLAIVNPGNDLAEMIRDHVVGEVNEDSKIETIYRQAEKVIVQKEYDLEVENRSKSLFNKNYSVERMVDSIVAVF